jgi:hypothetical protein
LSSNSIRLVADVDGWAVVIHENGEEYRLTFTYRENAENWMDGQRIRLGLRPSGDRDDASAE